MDVGMGMRLAPIPHEVVSVFMVLVVGVGVCMFLALVRMPVRVTFSDVQPDSHRHQRACNAELPRN